MSACCQVCGALEMRVHLLFQAVDQLCSWSGGAVSISATMDVLSISQPVFVSSLAMDSAASAA